MSLEATADRVAERLMDQEWVTILAHHDADGIAAGSILCHALLRRDIRVHLKVSSSFTLEEIDQDGCTVLCDFGASLEQCPDEVIVMDHHVPLFEGACHVNPRLFGVDGERELSASGIAYLVAQQMGDNRDLAGLVLLGIIGDGQEVAGMNHDIVSEAIAHGFVVPHRGLVLPGRDLPEQLYLALNPYLEGISGDENRVDEILAAASPNGDAGLDSLISRVVLEIAPTTPASVMERLYGDTFELEREVVHDAHTLTALVDACGKSGRGGLGAALCLRSAHCLEEAWEVARQHRTGVIEAIKSVKRHDEGGTFFEVDNAAAASDVADHLAFERIYTTPVVVMAPQGTACTVSARCPTGVDADCAALVREIATRCGGDGGGHATRAGATIPADAADCFIHQIREAIRG
jgi:single-stranded-DNA-specific exonuclease